MIIKPYFSISPPHPIICPQISIGGLLRKTIHSDYPAVNKVADFSCLICLENGQGRQLLVGICTSVKARLSNVSKITLSNILFGGLRGIIPPDPAAFHFIVIFCVRVNMMIIGYWMITLFYLMSLMILIDCCEL